MLLELPELRWPTEQATAILQPEHPGTWGTAMANRKRRTTTRSKGRKTRATMRKKTIKRAAAEAPKKSAKNGTTRARRKELSKRIKARQQKRRATPVVEQTVIDIVDEPLPGVVRVTEIEETDVRVPDNDDAE